MITRFSQKRKRPYTQGGIPGDYHYAIVNSIFEQIDDRLEQVADQYANLYAELL
jgi:hypothetical protein